MKKVKLLGTVLLTVLCVSYLNAEVVVALTPFNADSSSGEHSTVISQIMQAELSQSTNITLVDRQQMDMALSELKLAQQGMISPESARNLSNIVGARYLCSGFMREVDDRTMVTVKIIDIETTLTKLAYAFLKSDDDAVKAGKTLANQVVKVVDKFGHLSLN